MQCLEIDHEDGLTKKSRMDRIPNEHNSKCTQTRVGPISNEHVNELQAPELYFVKNCSYARKKQIVHKFLNFSVNLYGFVLER